MSKSGEETGKTNNHKIRCMFFSGPTCQRGTRDVGLGLILPVNTRMGLGCRIRAFPGNVPVAAVTWKTSSHFEVWLNWGERSFHSLSLLRTAWAMELKSNSTAALCARRLRGQAVWFYGAVLSVWVAPEVAFSSEVLPRWVTDLVLIEYSHIFERFLSWKKTAAAVLVRNEHVFSSCTDASAACDSTKHESRRGGSCKLPPVTHSPEGAAQRETPGQVSSRPAEPEQVCELAGNQVAHCLASTRVKTMWAPPGPRCEEVPALPCAPPSHSPGSGKGLRGPSQSSRVKSEMIAAVSVLILVSGACTLHIATGSLQDLV